VRRKKKKKKSLTGLTNLGHPGPVLPRARPRKTLIGILLKRRRDDGGTRSPGLEGLVDLEGWEGQDREGSEGLEDLDLGDLEDLEGSEALGALEGLEDLEDLVGLGLEDPEDLDLG
jgi:hypothetical protein